MELKLSYKRKYESGLGFLLVVFRRIVALFLIAFGLNHWMRIVGLSQVEGLRFDTMSEPWQAASCLMAVLLPIAAIGLWGLFAWGTSTWLIAAATELTLHLRMPEIFGEAREIVLFHIACLVIYVVIKLLMFIRRRRFRLPRSGSGLPA